MSTTHRIAATGALILSLAAADGPTATARTDRGTTTANTPPAAVYSRQDKSIIPATPPSTSAGDPTKMAVVRVETAPGGFDWGDAGIGAGGGLALAMLGLGGALARSQRHPHR
ncbi:MAG: hypothetical protein ACJ780_18715 [Solirubrobacteraceae bacterium]